MATKYTGTMCSTILMVSPSRELYAAPFSDANIYPFVGLHLHTEKNDQVSFAIFLKSRHGRPPKAKVRVMKSWAISLTMR